MRPQPENIVVLPLDGVQNARIGPLHEPHGHPGTVLWEEVHHRIARGEVLSGATDLERHEPPKLRGHHPAFERCAVKPEGSQFVGWKIDPAFAQVLADIPQHVGELHGDAETDAVRIETHSFGAKHRAEHQTHDPGHLVGIALQIAEGLHLHRLKVRGDAIEELQQGPERNGMALERVAQREPARMLGLRPCVQGADGGAEQRQLMPHLRDRTVAAEVDEVVGIPAVIVERKDGAALGRRDEPAREVEASRPGGRDALRVGVTPVERGRHHATAPCSATIRSTTSREEMSTIGTPQPGCVLCPTKNRFVQSAWRLWGRK